MEFTSEDYEYLEGVKFSGGYKLVLKNNPLYDRIDLIKKLTKGKSVLHVGCCDHIPLIEDKIRSNTWLHRILELNCSKVTGVDISKEAVDYINKKGLSKEAVYCADITQSTFKELVPKTDYDYVLLGEILEHVDNPVDFLEKMDKTLCEFGFSGRFIITVPNAFSLQRFGYRRGVECINSDHKYWFTPYTLAKVLTDAGIKPQELFFANQGRGGNAKNKLSQLLFINLERIRKRPAKYASFRGSQLVIIGKHVYE